MWKFSVYFADNCPAIVKKKAKTIPGQFAVCSIGIKFDFSHLG